MARRPRSSINSHYFTKDPVLVREPGIYQNSKFFTKGSENSPKKNDDNESLNSSLPISGSQSSVLNNESSINVSQSISASFPSEMSPFHKPHGSSDSSVDNNSGNSDVFTVDGPDGSLQVDRGLLRETLQQLKSDSQTPVNELSAEKTEAFKSVLEALRMLYSNQSAYELVLGDIRREFNNITTVKPGTVAAFFIGCFTNDKFTGPAGCSPNCVASVFPTNGTPGYNHCDDLVLIYNEGIFSSLNEKKSAHAYIYVGDANFTGFTSLNINQLKDAGVENASIIFGNHDGTFREVTSVLPLNQLPQVSQASKSTKGKVGKAGATGAADETPNDSGENNNAAGVTVVVIIVVAIIVLLFLIYRNNYRY